MLDITEMTMSMCIVQENKLIENILYRCDLSAVLLHYVNIDVYVHVSFKRNNLNSRDLD